MSRRAAAVVHSAACDCPACRRAFPARVSPLRALALMPIVLVLAALFLAAAAALLVAMALGWRWR